MEHLLSSRIGSRDENHFTDQNKLKLYDLFTTDDIRSLFECRRIRFTVKFACLRRIWGLPYDSHSNMLLILSDSLPLFDLICHRLAVMAVSVEALVIVIDRSCSEGCGFDSRCRPGSFLRFNSARLFHWY